MRAFLAAVAADLDALTGSTASDQRGEADEQIAAAGLATSTAMWSGRWLRGWRPTAIPLSGPEALRAVGRADVDVVHSC